MSLEPGKRKLKKLRSQTGEPACSFSLQLCFLTAQCPQFSHISYIAAQSSKSDALANKVRSCLIFSDQRWEVALYHFHSTILIISNTLVLSNSRRGDKDKTFDGNHIMWNGRYCCSHSWKVQSDTEDFISPNELWNKIIALASMLIFMSLVNMHLLSITYLICSVGSY